MLYDCGTFRVGALYTSWHIQTVINAKHLTKLLDITVVGSVAYFSVNTFIQDISVH